MQFRVASTLECGLLHPVNTLVRMLVSLIDLLPSTANSQAFAAALFAQMIVAIRRFAALMENVCLPRRCRTLATLLVRLQLCIAPQHV